MSLILKLLNKFNSISKSKDVVMCWMPSHDGIIGNDKADSAAKRVENIEIKPNTDLRAK